MLILQEHRNIPVSQGKSIAFVQKIIFKSLANIVLGSAKFIKQQVSIIKQ